MSHFWQKTGPCKLTKWYSGICDLFKAVELQVYSGTCDFFKDFYNYIQIGKKSSQIGHYKEALIHSLIKVKYGKIIFLLFTLVAA
jgi:hypothetical protein